MFRFRVWLQNPKCGYQYRNPDFPIKRNPRVCAWRSKIADCWWRWSFFFSDQMGPAHMSRLQLPGFWAYYLRQCKCCTVADPGWISGSGWLSPPPPPPSQVRGGARGGLWVWRPNPPPPPLSEGLGLLLLYVLLCIQAPEWTRYKTKLLVQLVQSKFEAWPHEIFWGCTWLNSTQNSKL